MRSVVLERNRWCCMGVTEVFHEGLINKTKKQKNPKNLKKKKKNQAATAELGIIWCLVPCARANKASSLCDL